MNERSIQPLSMAGSCRNGFERDSGRLYHAVTEGQHKAICGAMPGRRSAGWSSHVGKDVTCPRCLKRLGSQAKETRVGQQP